MPERSSRLDLSFSLPQRAGNAPGSPELLALAAARTAATPTARAQAGLPMEAGPADASFDMAVAAVLAAGWIR